MERPLIYISNDYIYSVRLMYNYRQPFVCGTLKQVVEYALKPNNGIDYFCEITTEHKVKKLAKKTIKKMLIEQELKHLSDELFKKY